MLFKIAKAFLGKIQSPKAMRCMRCIRVFAQLNQISLYRRVFLRYKETDKEADQLLLNMFDKHALMETNV